MHKNKLKLVAVVVVVALIAAFFALGLQQYLNFDYLKAQQESFQTYYAENRALTIGLYFLLYVAVTALSLPGAGIMTLAGGALFGLAVGTVVVSFASTIGATLAFLTARFVLRDTVQEKFRDKLAVINREIQKDGAFYLFTLRLVPLFPFFVINLVMGVTPISTLQFAWVSQLGMLAGTLVFVNAGTQLSKIDSLRGILSPNLLLSFVILGVFPLVARKIVDAIKRRRHISSER